MKKYLILLLFLVFIQGEVFATPVIENVLVNPQQLWVGESTTISLNCYDNENKTINNVFADMVGPGIIIPRLYFTGNYGLSVDKAYLDRVGQYDSTISCTNNDNQSFSTLTSFTVSKLTGYISSIQPKPGYIGEWLEIDFFVKKDDTPLSSGVNFNLTLNDQIVPLKIPPAYDLNKGWMLKIDSPSTEGIYSVKVYAFYDRSNVTNSSSIELRRRIDFGIGSLSDSWVESNENITVNIRAKDKGNVIDVNKNNLFVQIASTSLNILSISKNGDSYDVLITAPYISAGTYDLRATLNYDGNSYSDAKQISYIVGIKGKMIDSSNRGISTLIRFISNDVEKLRISTDSAGYYSSTLPPDTYDVQVMFPQSTLYLERVPINSFNDPIKYFYSTDYLVPGIRSAGLFDYKLALTYDEARLEMNYDEKNILDETGMIIYKCSVWNSGRKVCNDKWTEINGEIDNIRNLVKVNLSSLSAFIIGERKSIVNNFNLDSQRYYTGSLTKVIGFLKDADGDPVQNATIKAYVKNTLIKVDAFSDNNGVFSFEFKSPEDEGNYTLVLNVEKNPYISSSDSKYFITFKSREIVIVTPDTVKLKQGQNSTQEFSITNVGQADLFNLNISLSGIPSIYYNLTDFLGRLKQDEEAKFYVRFSIPDDAEKKIYSASLAVSNSEIKQEKIFGFSVIGKNETVTNLTSVESPSGNFILPKLGSNIYYIAIFAICCFSIAIVLKKIKVRKSKRDDIKGFLFDIKNNFGKRKFETMAGFRNRSDYRKIISSEFPNALKNIDDEHGKNN